MQKCQLLHCGNILIQGSAKRHRPGLVNFTVAVAYHFCLSLPETFTQPGRSLIAEPCIRRIRKSVKLEAYSTEINTKDHSPDLTPHKRDPFQALYELKHCVKTSISIERFIEAKETAHFRDSTCCCYPIEQVSMEKSYRYHKCGWDLLPRVPLQCIRCTSVAHSYVNNCPIKGNGDGGDPIP